MHCCVPVVIQCFEENLDTNPKFMFNIVRCHHFHMVERMVEIPVYRTVRDRIKSIKGTETYSDFLKRVIEYYMPQE